MKQVLHGQGFGRHSVDEVASLAARDFAAAAAILGDKPYLFGDTPCGADATLFAFAASAAAPLFKTQVRQAAEAHANLVAYQWRFMERYYEPALAN